MTTRPRQPRCPHGRFGTCRLCIAVDKQKFIDHLLKERDDDFDAAVERFMEGVEAQRDDSEFLSA
jgi:hypothetical protein